MLLLFADDFKKYLTTDLIKELDDSNHLLSNKIVIESIEFVN